MGSRRRGVDPEPPRSDVLKAIASSPTTSPNIAAQFATHTDPAVRSAAARHPGLDASVLEALSDDTHAPVRWQVAGHANTPADTLVKLATDPVRQVRHHLLANTNQPPEMLEVFSRDSDSKIQAYVVSDPAVTAEMLDRLASSRSSRIRTVVASHPDTPATTLARLARSADSGVRCAAASHPDCPPEAVVAEVPTRELHDPDLDPAVLEKHSTHPDSYVRETVASHPATSSDVLAKLSAARGAVAAIALRNPNCPPDALNAAARRNHRRTRILAAEHRRTDRGERRSPCRTAHCAGVAVDEEPELPRRVSPQRRSGTERNPASGSQVNDRNRQTTLQVRGMGGIEPGMPTGSDAFSGR